MLPIIEVIPVTPDEILRILGSPTMEETEKLLDNIKRLREEETLSKKLILVYAT
jgi:DNA-binding transcriptional ArsR family regulator